MFVLEVGNDCEAGLKTALAPATESSSWKNKDTTFVSLVDQDRKTPDCITI